MMNGGGCSPLLGVAGSSLFSTSSSIAAADHVASPTETFAPEDDVSAASLVSDLEARG